MCQISLLLVSLLLLFTVVSAEKYCTRKENLSNVQESRRYTNATCFLVFEKSTLLKCIKTCMMMSICQSVNLDVNNGDCYLYSKQSNQYDFTSDVSFVAMDVKDWPKHISGNCFNHTCPNNNICVPGDIQIYSCVPVGCSVTPETVNLLPAGRPLFENGYVLESHCSEGFYLDQPIVCDASGVWTEMSCKALPTKCDMLKSCNATYQDGEYWLHHKNGSTRRPMKVYCHNLDTTSPTEFITLAYPNIITKSTYQYVDEELCTVENMSSTAIQSKGLGDTIFFKVGLQHFTLKLRKFDSTFTNSTMSFHQYAGAYACYGTVNTSCPALGHFIIDLRNTSFHFKSGLEWEVHDFNPTSYIDNITYSHDNRVIEGRCGGSCGGCKIGSLELEINDDDDHPEFDSAIFPVCNTSVSGSP